MLLRSIRFLQNSTCRGFESHCYQVIDNIAQFGRADDIPELVRF